MYKHCLTVRILLANHACAFGHHYKHCLTSTFCLSISKTIFACHKEKCLSRNVCVMAKLTNVVLYKQSFKCWSKNAYSFGWGFIPVLNASLKIISKEQTLVFASLLLGLLCLQLQGLEFDLKTTSYRLRTVLTIKFVCTWLIRSWKFTNFSPVVRAFIYKIKVLL